MIRLVYLLLLLTVIPLSSYGIPTEFDVSLFRPNVGTFYSGVPPVDLTETSGEMYGSSTFGLEASIPIGKAHINLTSGLLGYQWLCNAELSKTQTTLSFADESPSITSGSISVMGLFLSKSKNLYFCSFGLSFSEHNEIDEPPSYSFTGFGAGTYKLSESTHLIYGGILTNSQRHTCSGNWLLFAVIRKALLSDTSPGVLPVHV